MFFYRFWVYFGTVFGAQNGKNNVSETYHSFDTFFGRFCNDFGYQKSKKNCPKIVLKQYRLKKRETLILLDSTTLFNDFSPMGSLKITKKTIGKH